MNESISKNLTLLKLDFEMLSLFFIVNKCITVNVCFNISDSIKVIFEKLHLIQEKLCIMVITNKIKVAKTQHKDSNL